MQRYASYKPSEVKWLGDVPVHWEVRPGFTCFKENKDRNKGLVESTVLSLSYGRIVIKPEEKLTGLVPESFEGYQLIKPGDIVIRTTDLQNDQTSLRVGYAKDKGMITAAYLGLRCHPEINPEYVFRLLESYDALKVFYGMGSGLRQNIDFWDFKRLPIPLPPRDEQDRIVAFLDQKTAEIDAAITKKERLIGLLNEQKHVLINRAIACGLNPDVSQRDSGYPWIGSIPSHWKILRFKYCSSIRSGQVDPRREPYASLPLIAPNHIESGTGKLLQIETAREQGADSGKYQLEAGDLVYSKIRPALRKACLSPVAGLCSADMYVLRPKGFINKRYLLGYLLTDAFTLPALDAALRVAMPKVNREALGDFPVLVPPMDEQEAIADFMLTCDECFNPVIDAAKGEVAKLSELRALLISSAVSGKLRT